MHVLQDPADGFTAFVLVTTLPVAVYFTTHWAAIFQWVHLWSLLLLASGPLLLVTSLKDGLWWLGEGRAVNALRRLLLLASLAVFLAALEERVIFHSFNQYIRLTAPWNYLAVTGEAHRCNRTRPHRAQAVAGARRHLCSTWQVVACRPSCGVRERAGLHGGVHG